MTSLSKSFAGDATPAATNAAGDARVPTVTGVYLGAERAHHARALGRIAARHDRDEPESCEGGRKRARARDTITTPRARRCESIDESRPVKKPHATARPNKT